MGGNESVLHTSNSALQEGIPIPEFGALREHSRLGSRSYNRFGIRSSNPGSFRLTGYVLLIGFAYPSRASARVLGNRSAKC